MQAEPPPRADISSPQVGAWLYFFGGPEARTILKVGQLELDLLQAVVCGLQALLLVLR